MSKWNVGYEQLSKVNPRLVMLSISAYGQTGPYALRPGFGTLAEAMSGYAYINGQADGPPTLPSFGLADGIAGLNGAFGVLAALRYRDQHGVGQHVDATLYEPLLTVLGPQVIEYDQLGIVQERLGSRLPFSAPRNVYMTKDGKWLSMSSSAQSVFERTMHAIGKPDLITDERFLDNRKRGANVEALDGYIADWCRERTMDEALEILVKNEAAAAPVYSVADVVADPHFTARGSVVSVEDSNLGPVRMQAPFPRLSKSPGAIRSTGAKLGEHNREVYGSLLELGDADLGRLKQAGVI
jgi:formyl-CoA transferase